MPISPLWDPNSQLWTDPQAQKGLSCDASAAFGLLGFISENPEMKLVLTGRFPKAKYMSLQAYRGMLQGTSGVGDVLTDYLIDPDTGDNPFRTGDFTNSGTFKIEITPDPLAHPDAIGGPKKNCIWYDPNPGQFGSSILTAFYRVYQPVGTVTMADLPEIKAYNYKTGIELPLPPSQRLDWYLDLPEQAKKVLNEKFISLILGGGWIAPGTQVQMNFRETDSSAGSNMDARYAYCYNAIPHGRVAVIKFRAPAINLKSQDPSTSSRCVRYWSICPIHYPMLLTLNGLPCDWSDTGERDITLVFGPDTTEIKNKATSLGAKFLPDRRSIDQKVMGFIVRNFLPSQSFAGHVFKGEYQPTGKIFNREDFLSL